jgi:branched-subunit amino acid aminotransferase/4-amino-4-deoxychorismate lyase
MQFMFLAKWTKADGWKSEGMVPFGNLSMPPSAQVLNYGQGLFEGMKAVKSADGTILLFRPIENAKRMQAGAERMGMQILPKSIFLQGVADLVTKNATYVRCNLPKNTLVQTYVPIDEYQRTAGVLESSTGWTGPPMAKGARSFGDVTAVTVFQQRLLVRWEM